MRKNLISVYGTVDIIRKIIKFYFVKKIFSCLFSVYFHLSYVYIYMCVNVIAYIYIYVSFIAYIYYIIYTYNIYRNGMILESLAEIKFHDT